MMIATGRNGRAAVWMFAACAALLAGEGASAQALPSDFDRGAWSPAEVLASAGEAAARMPQPPGALLLELRPGAAVTLARELSESIARDARSISATSFVNGIKIEGLLDSIRAAAKEGPGLFGGVNLVPGAALGKCAVPPRENALSLRAVRLAGTGEDARLFLDFGGQTCIESIELRHLKGVSRVPDLAQAAVTDLEETFGAARLRVAPAERLTQPGEPGGF